MAKPQRVVTQTDINQQRGCGCLIACLVGLVAVVVFGFRIFAG